MTDKSTEVLVRALTYIEKGWCQNTSAMIDLGKFGNLIVMPTHWFANQWCASGAIDRASLRVTHKPYSAAGNDALRRLQRAIDTDVITWNDVVGRQKEDIVKAFREAIQAAPQPAASPLSQLPKSD